jgi:hypothetical protein
LILTFIINFIQDPEEADFEATSTWSSANILKQKSNRKNLLLGKKKKTNMGYSKPQKTLQKIDKHKISPSKIHKPKSKEIKMQQFKNIQLTETKALETKASVNVDSSVINHQPVKPLKFKSDESDDSIIQSSSDDDVKIDEATSTDLQKKNIFVTFAKFNLKLLRKKINTSLNKNTVKTSSVLKQSFLSVMI